jgi:glutamyl-tRNA reductase
MTERIVNRLLHDPTQAIRAQAADGAASKEYARLVRNLFGLREDAQ